MGLPGGTLAPEQPLPPPVQDRHGYGDDEEPEQDPPPLEPPPEPPPGSPSTGGLLVQDLYERWGATGLLKHLRETTELHKRPETGPVLNVLRKGSGAEGGFTNRLPVFIKRFCWTLTGMFGLLYPMVTTVSQVRFLTRGRFIVVCGVLQGVAELHLKRINRSPKRSRRLLRADGGIFAIPC